MDVGEWLRGLGLDRYVPAFLDAELTAANLAELTDADLRELGLPLGPRKTVLRAIEALGTPSAAPASPSGPSPAERRQLTVMFVDLVGSTALSARLDPEEMGAVLRAYQNAVAGEIARFEGHVAKFMGDGVLAYFGWPVAHEDEPERAVRAALAIIDAVSGLKAAASEPLACRIGIATGLVVVGEMIGEGVAQEQTVVGETPNLAARLQALAAPGQVVIGETTRRLLGTGFALDDLGAKALKGIEGAVGAFAVTGERVLASRFEGRADALQPMVGRDHELGLLLERWSQAGADEGQAVLLVGEAGIGKSRITRALLDALRPEPHTRIRYQCSPFHTGSALWPAIQQLEHAARFTADDSPEARLDKLEQALGDGAAADAAPLLTHLLGLDGTARYGALELAPTVLRARTLEVLVRQLLALAAQQPVLLLIEDAHWADPTTLELIEAWLDAIADAPVLLVLTSRPDNQPALGAHPHVTRLSLNRLSRAGIEAIVARLGGERLPPATLDAIIARTDGVPLYVEELTKAILETGETAIPASLHDSLMARLDRTPEVKEIAQIAACIGREFDHGLLAAVADRSSAELTGGLDKLTTAELIFRRGVPPEASYLFKHALVRDAAYESLLRSKRQAVHRRILNALETAGALPQLLGHHAREAGLVESAIGHFETAGRQALAKPAYLEAIANLRQAVALVASLGDDVPQRRRVLELQTVIGPACIGGYGYGAAETGVEYERALALLHRIGDSPLWMPVYYGNWAVRYVRANHQDALRVAEEMVERARGQDDDAATLVAYRVLGTTQSMLGRTAEALLNIERAWQLYDPARHRALTSMVGQDPGAAALIYKAICLGYSGALDEATRTAESAVALARESRHPLTIAYTFGHANLLWSVLADLPRATAINDENLAYSEVNGIRIWQVFSLVWQAVVLEQSDRHQEALAVAGEALPRLVATGTALFQPFLHSAVATSLLALGRHAECEARLEDARRQIETSGERWIEPDIHRIEGNLRLARGDEAAAQLCYRRAIEIARGQEGRLLELRAATALCRLLASQGQRRQAQDLLTPLYGWFTEGFDARDLVEARALMDELR